MNSIESASTRLHLRSLQIMLSHKIEINIPTKLVSRFVESRENNLRYSHLVLTPNLSMTNTLSCTFCFIHLTSASFCS